MQTCTEVSQWLCTQVQEFCLLPYEANNGNPEGVGLFKSVLDLFLNDYEFEFFQNY
jgi:hypothetical protein